MRKSFFSPFLLLIGMWTGCTGNVPGGANDGNGQGGTTFPPEPSEEVGEVNSDFWTATDPLGRELPDYESVGAKRSDKYVAMFYWTWHNPDMVNYGTVGNISRIQKEYPEAIYDADHPAWDRGGSNTHFWGEPLFGYYRTTDPYVLRKHAEMLADAGVDVVFFDCTNAPFLWKESYTALMETWAKARKDGVNTPKISFLLPFGPSEHSYAMIKTLYEDIYRPNKYSELWFYWRGKPMLMAHDNIPADNASDRAMKNFFTFRPGQPDYVNGPSDPSQWGWLEVYPQNPYANNEEMPVGVSQNTCASTSYHASAFNRSGTFGRSYMGKTKSWDTREDSYLYGANFEEQWERALELNPQLVFVTGWNEYIAGKWPVNEWESDLYPYAFVDQYDWEHSRDIEPNNEWYDEKGNYRGDTYYYQLIRNIRKFKGMSKRVEASGTKTITIGGFDGWDDVFPDFRHYKGNAVDRAHNGHANTYYVSNLGRNDIVDAKVARDDDNLYFYVETASPLTAPTDKNWMWLLIDADRDKSTGWEGYDYIFNYESPVKGTGVVSKNTENGWAWEPFGEFTYAVRDNKMELCVSRAMLGLETGMDFEFKWVDNMQPKISGQQSYDASLFYTCGDAAPGGRFNFVYTVD